MSETGSDEGVRDAGYDEWVDAAADGEAYYLECPAGHGSLPPRRVCPTCGADDLSDRPLPTPGLIETVTITHVATPSFVDDAPYAVAIADFGPVRLTGQVVDVDLESVDTGDAVVPDVRTTETSGDRVVAFRPA